MSKQKIGYIGVGLMGHGAAKNILEKGHPLTIMGHRNRAPVDDLLKAPARERAPPRSPAGATFCFSASPPRSRSRRRCTARAACWKARMPG
jgi:6-phosphogluconate dehydrogenase